MNSVSIALALTVLVVVGMNFSGAIGYCFWDQFPGCKENLSLSSPLLTELPTPQITLTLLNCFEAIFPRIMLTLYVCFRNTYMFADSRCEKKFEIVFEIICAKL